MQGILEAHRDEKKLGGDRLPVDTVYWRNGVIDTKHVCLDDPASCSSNVSETAWFGKPVYSHGHDVAAALTIVSDSKGQVCTSHVHEQYNPGHVPMSGSSQFSVATTQGCGKPFLHCMVCRQRIWNPERALVDNSLPQALILCPNKLCWNRCGILLGGCNGSTMSPILNHSFCFFDGRDHVGEFVSRI